MSNPEKSEDIYERLVAALDALHHGFLRTPSGVEIKLIKKAFTPEEVGLASQLTRIPETAADIAKRIGCGVCVIGCPTDAIELAPVSAEEWFHVPSSMAEWEEMRLQNMASTK